MKIDRKIAAAPMTTHIGKEIAALNGPCIGCADCKGICATLIELVSLPNAILKQANAT